MTRAVAQATVLREPRHVIAMLRLLVLVGVVMLGVSRPPAQASPFWFLAILYGATTLGYLWARNRDFAVLRVKWMMYGFDVLIVSLLILFRGGQVSTFISAYLGVVLVTATVEGLGNAILNAVLVATVHSVLTRWGTPFSSYLSFESTSQLVFFLVISLFLGHVAESSRKDAVERRLAEQARTEAQEVLRSTSTHLEESEAQLQVARESLRAQERLAALGMLSAGIAHEMRNPLAAILVNLEEVPGFLDDVRSAASPTDVGLALDEIRSVVTDCRLATDHLTRIASDLTGIVREGPSQGGVTDARDGLEAAERLLRVRLRGGTEVNVECATPRAAEADPSHLLQVLLNLGSNAIDAMEGSAGLLTLRAEDAGPRHVAFVVRDTGPGMPAEVLERLYEPFVTTKPPGKGTGLGLHLVSEIVKAHGGTIDCRTAAGQGTQFRVVLPAASEPSGARTTDEPERPAVLESRRYGIGPGPEGDVERAARGRRGDHSPGARTHAPQGAV